MPAHYQNLSLNRMQMASCANWQDKQTNKQKNNRMKETMENLIPNQFKQSNSTHFIDAALLIGSSQKDYWFTEKREREREKKWPNKARL